VLATQRQRRAIQRVRACVGGALVDLT
jgi:hypothetical protein